MNANLIVTLLLAVPGCLCIELAVRWAIRATEPKKRP